MRRLLDRGIAFMLHVGAVVGLAAVGRCDVFVVLIRRVVPVFGLRVRRPGWGLGVGTAHEVRVRGRVGRRRMTTRRPRGVRPAPRMPVVWARNLRWRGWVPTSFRPGGVVVPGVLYSPWLFLPPLTLSGTPYPTSPVLLPLLLSPLGLVLVVPRPSWGGRSRDRYVAVHIPLVGSTRRIRTTF